MRVTRIYLNEFEIFMSLNANIEELSKGAKSLLKVKERLEVVNN